MRTGYYKGKIYRVIFIGPTKFGNRARLGFMNNYWKSFWVDAEKVVNIIPPVPVPKPEPAPVNSMRDADDANEFAAGIVDDETRYEESIYEAERNNEPPPAYYPDDEPIPF